MTRKAEGAVPDLGEIRKRIDDIDERIQSLINERAQFAREVGESKGELAEAVDYYRPERERRVFHRENSGFVGRHEKA